MRCSIVISFSVVLYGKTLAMSRKAKLAWNWLRHIKFCSALIILIFLFMALVGQGLLILEVPR